MFSYSNSLAPSTLTSWLSVTHHVLTPASQQTLWQGWPEYSHHPHPYPPPPAPHAHTHQAPPPHPPGQGRTQGGARGGLGPPPPPPKLTPAGLNESCKDWTFNKIGLLASLADLGTPPLSAPPLRKSCVRPCTPHAHTHQAPTPTPHAHTHINQALLSDTVTHWIW